MTDGPEAVASTPDRPVREAWAAGRAARTAWLTIPDAHLAETVAARGVAEAVTLDLQHGLFDHAAAVHAIRAVAACRYPPRGHRSFGPTRGAVRPGADASAAAERALVFAMVETRAGLEGCEALAAVDGLDGLFVGPGDLGLSLGLGAGQDREEPELRDALARVLAACRSAGKRAGIHAATARYAAGMARSGFDLVTVWVDAAAVAASLAAVAEVWARREPVASGLAPAPAAGGG